MPQFFPLYILEPLDHTYKEQVPHCRTSSMAQNLPAMQETGVPSLSREDQLEEWQPTPVLLPGEFHGQRSQVGHSLWGHKESD